uniref:MOSC domain-containing protein n=1 Tax=Panagrolaimus superbus TaxID=310955 RepID=A0A914YHH5_9BILA
MITTESSVDELNERLSKLEEDKCKVSTRNFRPNLSIEGTKPFDEDWWLDVKIGEAEFACFKPCTRCIMTTVDPDEGRFLKNMQPFRLLKSYRLSPPGKLRNLYEDAPVFGVNVIIKKEGRIHVGDKVFVRYKPSPF